MIGEEEFGYLWLMMDKGWIELMRGFLIRGYF
jgi:hypothetical protein